MFLVIAFAVMAAGVGAQENERLNSVALTGSVSGFGGYNSFGFGQASVEYDRVLPGAGNGRLSVSAIALYAPLGARQATDTYTLKERFTFAGAKANFNFPVVHRWLGFRVGLGAGAGWHRSTGYFMGQLSTASEPLLDTHVAAHVMVDAWWVLRAAPWLELRFAPLVVSPSQFIFGGRFNHPHNDRMFTYFNMWTLGAAVRF